MSATANRSFRRAHARIDAAAMKADSRSVAEIRSTAAVKSCPCCRRVFAAGQWDGLTLCGDIVFDGTRLELRNCQCGSTISVKA